jgi:hypothetical protein
MQGRSIIYVLRGSSLYIYLFFFSFIVQHAICAPFPLPSTNSGSSSKEPAAFPPDDPVALDKLEDVVTKFFRYAIEVEDQLDHIPIEIAGSSKYSAAFVIRFPSSVIESFTHHGYRGEWAFPDQARARIILHPTHLYTEKAAGTLGEFTRLVDGISKSQGDKRVKFVLEFIKEAQGRDNEWDARVKETNDAFAERGNAYIEGNPAVKDAKEKHEASRVAADSSGRAWLAYQKLGTGIPVESVTDSHPPEVRAAAEDLRSARDKEKAAYQAYDDAVKAIGDAAKSKMGK